MRELATTEIHAINGGDNNFPNNDSDFPEDNDYNPRYTHISRYGTPEPVKPDAVQATLVLSQEVEPRNATRAHIANRLRADF